MTAEQLAEHLWCAQSGDDTGAAYRMATATARARYVDIAERLLARLALGAPPLAAEDLRLAPWATFAQQCGPSLTPEQLARVRAGCLALAVLELMEHADTGVTFLYEQGQYAICQDAVPLSQASTLVAALEAAGARLFPSV